MVVTQQYLVGELSLLLSNVAAVAGDDACAREIVQLRYATEALPPSELAGVAIRALRLVDALCWAALCRGDIGAFNDQVEVTGRLYEFGVCAGLLDET